MAQVKTTFDKQYISGDRELFKLISVPNHGVKIHHEPEDDFITYYTGDKPQNKRGQNLSQKEQDFKTLYGGKPDFDNVELLPHASLELRVAGMHTCSSAFLAEQEINAQLSQIENTSNAKVNPDDRYKRQTA